MAVTKIVSAINNNVLTMDTTGCDSLVMVASNYGAPSFTDSKNGSGWVALTTRSDSDGTYTTMWYHESPAVGTSHAFTAPTAYQTMCVVGFTGWAASSAFDQESGSNLASNETTIQPGALTPSEGLCLVIAAIGTSFDPTASAPTNFTLASQIAGIGGTRYGMSVHYRIKGSGDTSAENPTFTQDTSAKATAVMAVFKSDGISGGGSSSGAAAHYYRQMQ